MRVMIYRWGLGSGAMGYLGIRVCGGAGYGG